MSGSELLADLRLAALAVALCALAACGDDAASPAGAADAPATPAASATTPAAPASTAPASAAPAVQAHATASPGAVGIGGTQTLNHPDDLQVVMLGYRLRGKAPPIAEWAAAQSVVKNANEFDRARMLEAERERLQGIYDGTDGVGSLRLNVNARFSEYDGGRGGYYLDAFTPGSSFAFSAQPAPHPFGSERVTLQVGNAEELNFWPLDAAAAQDALARNNGVRNVVLDSSFRIVGVSQGSDGPVVALRLQRYVILSSRYGQPAVLGERSFDHDAQPE